MSGRYSNPVPQYLDDNGEPLAGGVLYFYESGTDLAQAVYADEDLTEPMLSVELDAAGRCPNIFASYEDNYRVVLKTSYDEMATIVWTRDNVRFVDAQELVALAQELQEQIDNIALSVSNANPIRNSTTEVLTAQTSVTLTTSFQPHVCVGIDGRVDSNVSAGTMQSGTLAGLGSTSRQAKMAGVSGDSSSVVEWRVRVASAEARRFANQTCSISAKIRQESGLTAACEIAVSTANAADDFSATTLVGSNSTNVASGTNATLEYAGLEVGDVSNGIELVISCAPGASFSLKDFYLTDIKLEVGASVTDFSAPSYAETRAEALEVSLGVYRDTGSANAIAISTREALSLYDGLALNILRTASSTGALTLSVDNSSAITVVRPNGSACESGDTATGRVYRFRYDAANSRFVLENPEVRNYLAEYLLTARGYVKTTTPATPTVIGNGIASASRVAQGKYQVTLSNTYATSGSDILMYPMVSLFDSTSLGTGVMSIKVAAVTSTTFTIFVINENGGYEDPNLGFFVQVTGKLA